MSDDAAKPPVISGTPVRQPRLYQDVHEISKRILANSKIETSDALTFVRNTVLLRIQAHIMTERVAEIVHTYDEAPVYPSAHHAFIGTLPAGSFRRRFFCYFWGIDPNWVPLRRRHEVVVRRWVNLPEYGIPQQDVEEGMAFWV
jgi:hypothetical protein